MKCVAALLIISFVHILFVHNEQAFTGIKMCQRNCELTKGCTGIYFDPVHLKCRLLFDLIKSDEVMASAATKRIAKTSFKIDAVKTCSARNRVVVTRMGSIVCLQTEADTARQEYLRLLIAGLKWYQLDLKTRVVHRVNSPWKYVMCVAYLKIANRFVVSYYDQVFTTPVTDMKEIRLRRHISVFDIAADEAKNFIFLLVLIKRTTRTNNICTVSLTGAHLRCFAAECRNGLFALDTNGKRVYFYRKRKLASYTYNGTLILEYSQRIRCSLTMVYDLVKDVLYCKFGYRLKVITKTGRQTTAAVLTQLEKVNDMKIHSSYLYISSDSKKDVVFVVDVENQFKVQKMKLPEDEIGYHLCLF